jgi:hypothetical protein
MPINAFVLPALAEESKALMDLRRDAGSPSATTMRGHLRTLTETGVIGQDTDSLEIGGDCDLVRGLIDGLHGVLFGARPRR